MSNATRRHRSLLLVSIAASVILLMIAVMTRGSAQRRPSCRAVMIPAYLPPSTIVNLVNAPLRPSLIIVNPGNGPGTHPRSAYRDAVRAVRRVGARVLGYVATNYGTRPAERVLADVDRYMNWYRVDGIFFDETSHSAAQLPYYAALARRARSSPGDLVVLNPGVPPAPSYFDIADIVVTFEGRYSAYVDALARMPDWLRQQRPEQVAHLVYGASRDQAIAAAHEVRGAGYLYVTSGSLPDPWRSVPSYLQEEEEALEACS